MAKNDQLNHSLEGNRMAIKTFRYNNNWSSYANNYINALNE